MKLTRTHSMHHVHVLQPSWAEHACETARRPHSARSAREEPPEHDRFDGTRKIKVEQTQEMPRRLAVPKKTMEEKATTEDELQKGRCMLQA